MADPVVTLIITVRERYSLTEESLLNVLEATEGLDFDLVYVDVNSPVPVRDFLRRAAEQYGFTLARVEGYVAPNRARNIGLEYAKGKYVAFLDNDIAVTTGWLSALVRCAEEEGAWVVGPLYLQGELQERVVHMAGGDMQLTGSWGSREFLQTQRHFMKRLDEVPPSELVRQRCALVEFHCALVRRDVFDVVGNMDEALLTTREHIDFCLRVLAARGGIFFEPASVITYRVPPPFAGFDIPYFLLRWSDQWTKRTLMHFARKYGITPNYVERVAKTRNRRQTIVLDWLAPKLRVVIGARGATLVGGLFRLVEPLANQILVLALTRDATSIGHSVAHAGTEATDLRECDAERGRHTARTSRD